MNQKVKERIEKCDTYRSAAIELLLSYRDDNDPAIVKAFELLCESVGMDVTISTDTR